MILSGSKVLAETYKFCSQFGRLIFAPILFPLSWALSSLSCRSPGFTSQRAHSFAPLALLPLFCWNGAAYLAAHKVGLPGGWRSQLATPPQVVTPHWGKMGCEESVHPPSHLPRLRPTGLCSHHTFQLGGFIHLSVWMMEFLLQTHPCLGRSHMKRHQSKHDAHYSRRDKSGLFFFFLSWQRPFFYVCMCVCIILYLVSVPAALGSSIRTNPSHKPSGASSKEAHHLCPNDKF